MTEQTPIRVYLVDDHEVVREGLKTLLGRRDGFEIVGQAGTVAEAISEATRMRPDVVVMDVRLPDGSGIEACREIRETMPDTKVLILTSYSDDDAVFASILAGASGYVLKQMRGLLKAVMGSGNPMAIRRTQEGTTLFSALLVGLSQSQATKACKHLWDQGHYCLALRPEVLNNPDALWR